MNRLVGEALSELRGVCGVALMDNGAKSRGPFGLVELGIETAEGRALVAVVALPRTKAEAKRRGLKLPAGLAAPKRKRKR